MVATAQKLLTAEDVLDLPDDPRWELIEGQVVEVSPTQSIHVIVTSRLCRRLGRYFDAHPEVGDVWTGDGGYIVHRSPDTVVAPDLSIVSPDQIQRGTAAERAFLPFAPMIPIEVKSPGDTEAEIARKLSLYLSNDLHEVWWVRPSHRSITIHRPDGPISLLQISDTLTSEALPGFHLELSELFA